MNLIPPEYRLAAQIALFLAWSALAAWFGQHYASLSYERAIADQKAEAAQILADSEAAARKKDAQNAENARNADDIYQTMLADAYAGRDDFADELRKRRRASSCNVVPGAAAVAGEPAPVTARSDDGSGPIDPGIRLRDAVKKLQAFAVTCQGWAVKVGR